MTIYLLIILALTAAAVVLAMLMLSARKKSFDLEKEKEEAAVSLAAAELQYRELLDARLAEISDMRSKIAKSEATINFLEEQVRREKEEFEKLQAILRVEFKNIAAEILEDKTRKFKDTNKEAIDNIIKPLNDNISEFKKRVEDIYSDENKQRGALQNEIKNLLELNNRITQETTNLTNALRGNSKMQGDWGEMILETILETSNLEKGLHYSTQMVLKDEEGAVKRPDVILRLPDNKRIVIDAKASLTAFVNHCNCDDPQQRKIFLDEHLQSVRRHVNELGSKRYHELVESPDFVIMFIPNEPAFLTALQEDSSIWTDAYKKKVIITSPTNLFALLKIVDNFWKRDDQSRNAKEIADQGAKLYDKFVGFVDNMLKVGKGIDSASDAYAKAMGQLNTGPGNLVTQSRKLVKLGIKASKEMPDSILLEAEKYEEE